MFGEYFLFVTLKALQIKAQGKRSATLGGRVHAGTEPCKGSIIRADHDGTLSEFNFWWAFLSQGGAALTLGFKIQPLRGRYCASFWCDEQIWNS